MTKRSLPLKAFPLQSDYLNSYGKGAYAQVINSTTCYPKFTPLSGIFFDVYYF